jgi:maltooligosyltrehalose trehalohydrolase
LAPTYFVQFLQNHDQVSNSLRGERLHQITSPARNRALTALLLLTPQIPLLFQGQEFGASAPFLYFADHNPELRVAVAKGRRKFLEQFPTVATAEGGAVLADPGDEQTFLRSKIDVRERDTHASVYRLHLDLLRLRREEPAIHAPSRVDGAVLAEFAFVLRLFSAGSGDRILVVNLGPDLHFEPAPEPLLAPLEGGGWEIQWSSESPLYGGNSTPPIETDANWIVPAESALLLRPTQYRELPHARVSEKD